jgi:hypothetical protein
MILSAATGSAGGLTLPLSAAVRKGYEDLYASVEAAIEGIDDGALLETLNDVHDGIGAVISADNRYRLEQNTALFEALLKQATDVNCALKKLQDQIAGIATGMERLGDVAAGIEKVMGMVPL